MLFARIQGLNLMTSAALLGKARLVKLKFAAVYFVN